jgi:hypothetical protein
VRSVIEAYSKKAKIAGREKASACGYGFGKSTTGVKLRVKSASGTADYTIDRWD